MMLPHLDFDFAQARRRLHLMIADAADDAHAEIRGMASAARRQIAQRIRRALGH